ncbi:tRNA wybutosine-synthesizing protein 3 homolog [Ylistrum balloti]|uniref:tRNA wybutosine-synthesizing protein 3 homolog n=1 Tax=Ylistrum balloti TaxID=509963 RepID=UPI002905E875|nr:tRNA wybutosine-synthesizing protein 3 homolog [Ylistrum balloti]
MDVLFDRQKSLALNGVDLSRKGSIDEEIVPLVQHINNHDNFFTTSSCSGRIIVFDDHIDEEKPGLKVKKKGCKWLYTSHKTADAEKVIESLKEITGDAVFKFEPFVLHVQCRNTEYAQRTLCCAVASGFRNSGISLGNKGKIIVGVRSTHGLEAPLSKDGSLLVSMEFIRFLTKSANKKLEENFLRIHKFFESVKKIDGMENKLARRERKKKDKRSAGDGDVEFVKNVKSSNKFVEPSRGTNSGNSVSTPSDLGITIGQRSPTKVGTISPGATEDSNARRTSKTADRGSSGAIDEEDNGTKGKCSCEAVDKGGIGARESYGSDEGSSSGTPVNEDSSIGVGSGGFDQDRYGQDGSKYHDTVDIITGDMSTCLLYKDLT